MRLCNAALSVVACVLSAAFNPCAAALTFTPLGDLPGSFFGSRAYGVSGDGSVVVGNGFSSNGAEAFVYNATDGMQSVRDLLIADGVDMTGWILREARAISTDGSTIVGYGTNFGQQEAWMVRMSAIIPEPSALLIGASASVGMVVSARRRR